MRDFCFVEILERVTNFQDLNPEEMASVMMKVLEGDLQDTQIASFLASLKMKGETAEEITASVEVLKQKAVKIDLKEYDLFDTCGTGGDLSNTFNVSTATAFVVAAAGVKVAKHGNRSISSKCGSADVLEKLGIRQDLSAENIKNCIMKTGLGFMYAPIFHTSLKNVQRVRKEIGIRTIFNVLGPLLNPADANLRLLGVYKKSLVASLAQTLKKIGVKRAMVVHGADGLDEISINDVTYVCELKEDKSLREFVIDPSEYGIKKASLDKVRGEDPEKNASMILDVFNGEKGEKRDLIVLNSGAALYVAGKVSDIGEGIKLAQNLIDNGSVLKKLERVRDFLRGLSYDA